MSDILDRIDDILMENGIIDRPFNKRSKLGHNVLEVYDKNLDVIADLTLWMINNGKDKKHVSLLKDGLKIAQEIIARAGSMSVADIRKMYGKVAKIRQSVPDSISSVNLVDVVLDCVKDTMEFCGALSWDLDECDEKQYKIISDVYLDRHGGAEPDYDEWKREAVDFLAKTELSFLEIEKKLENVLDASSCDSLVMAEKIIGKICLWRDAAAYSYLTFSADIAENLSGVEEDCLTWVMRNVGVDAKTNPKLSPNDKIPMPWKTDQGSYFVKAAKAKGYVYGKESV